MGFNETLKALTDFIAELNKSDANEQQKKILYQMKKIQKETKENRKTARIYLIIGIIASGIFGFFIEKIYGILSVQR